MQQLVAARYHPQLSDLGPLLLEDRTVAAVRPAHRC